MPDVSILSTTYPWMETYRLITGAQFIMLATIVLTVV
jgi:hypothetical protein